MQQILKFNVRNQNISRVDNFVPVRFSRNYLYAEFDFKTEDWTGHTKTALFKSDDLTIPVILGETDTCLVPWEILEKVKFTVSVFGGNLITVDSAPVKLYESGYKSSDIPAPSETLFEQLMKYFDETKLYTGEQAELSKRFAVGSLLYPESEKDNSKYFYEQTKEKVAGIDGQVEDAKKHIDKYVEGKEEELKGDTGNVYFAAFKVVNGRLIMYSDSTIDKVRFVRARSRLLYRLAF